MTEPAVELDAHCPARARQSKHADPSRVRVDGKFFWLGQKKFTLAGVTYGPFAPNASGLCYPSPARVEIDLELLARLHVNCLRVYLPPQTWFLERVHMAGLKLIVDVAWPKNISFAASPTVRAAAFDAVKAAAKQCGNHPAVLAISVLNEFPPDLLRYIGAAAVEDLIDELAALVRRYAPGCLVTFANFPTTEYLAPRDIDFAMFNVYLHPDTVFRNYLARLQSLTGDRPLVLGEYGLDTKQEATEADQARVLAEHVNAVFDEGLAGAILFSFTDDWFTGGHAVTEWAFGLTRADRSPKPALTAVAEAFANVPHTSSRRLPTVSVIVCSFNGAGTLGSCLLSMRRLRYPSQVEVVFVDDGSTDRTPEVLRQFPEVRIIRQSNHGLSHARNVGLAAATGEMVAYTDSDCEVDPDWLYYLAVTLRAGGYAGVGGPNLIPDEGSWIADCVGKSPGGPTHVMLDDRTAEHVPGCNMAFLATAARQINGFDPQFRKAGDDVDFIWRLQNLGHAVGFSPAAQVWHYRRNSVRAYLKQQRGYGEAEALLKYKHPDRFNVLGASHWRGRLYGRDPVVIRAGVDVVYHGTFGTGLFQTLYRRPSSLSAALLMSVEWHLLAAFVTLLALAFDPLFILAGLMFAVPVVLAIVAAMQTRLPRDHHPLARPLIAYLHFRQPITRGWARYAVRLKTKVMATDTAGYPVTSPLPFDPVEPHTLAYWHVTMDRLALLPALTAEVATAGWRARLDSGWAPWDMEIYGSRYVKVQITTASELHSTGKLTRVRVQPSMSRFCQLLLLASLALCGLLLLHLWPFSRPAVLLPTVVWALYLVNRRRVTEPVLGMIDSVAGRTGFYPVMKTKGD